jgi:sugar phosphate isomerase/epimerase
MKPNASRPAIAVQLYTLRDFLKTPSEIAASLKRVRKIGYRAVELAGLGPIAPTELVRILDGEGLTVCGSHVPMEAIQADPQRVIAELKTWNCPNVAVPGCWGKSLSDFKQFATNLNKAVETFAAAGLRLGYHNHSHELVKHDGRRPLDLLMETLSPRAWFEIDTYWITHGGGDPIAWINRVAGRIPCVHLKDMGIDEQGKQFMAEVGEGNLNFPGILFASRSAGAEWLVVEQDVCAGDPFESVTVSLRNLEELNAEF